MIKILNMASEAGAVFDLRYDGEVAFISNEALERFAALVGAAKKEGCANAADD